MLVTFEFPMPPISIVVKTSRLVTNDNRPVLEDWVVSLRFTNARLIKFVRRELA